MCRLILLFYLVLYVYISEAHEFFRYDYTYNEDAKGWLKLHKIPANFQDAFLRCGFEGAVLASPLNSGIRNAITSIIMKSDLSGGMYTGTHATLSHGDYTTIEGVPLGRLPVQWMSDEPDNYEGKEECLVMLPNGTMADVKCNETFPYVCYRADIKTPLISECGTVDKEYKLDKRTDSCYKFHRFGMTWRRAQSACLAEGGHLVIIDNDIEATVVKELFTKHPANTIISTFKDVASAGFSTWGSDNWFTVHGQPLEQAGYSKWSNDQPDNTNKQYCGGVFRTGLLDNVWCDTVKLAFICEKSPDSLRE